MRKLCMISALVLAGAAAAQERNSTCLWSEDFESGFPAGWVTNQVERQDPAGNGLGEFVPAFTAARAQEADNGGFFPVPDLPVGNRFAMANDDGFPCNCDLSEAMLETPSINLGGNAAIALDLRIFHTQALGGGDAFIDFSADGGAWLPLEQLPAAEGWQRLTYNISALGGIGDLRLRFRWSDNGNWASGFALDDLCIRALLVHDLAVTSVRLGDAFQSPFPPASNGLGYRLLPFEQTRATAATVGLHNLGSAELRDITVSVTATQNGVDHGPWTATLDSLLSGQRATVAVQTDWAPDALGEVTYSASAEAATGEEDATDNAGAASLIITGPGWDHGYGAMALDAGQSQGGYTTAERFIAANRFEVLSPGSSARGISAVLGTEVEEGALIRAILMDANFNLIDTSTRRAVTPEDIELAWGSGAVFLPLAQAGSLAPGDYFAGIQFLASDQRGSVALSGNCLPGTAALLVGSSFDVTWTIAIPMVRLHMNDYGVGMMAQGAAATFTARIHPQPFLGTGFLEFDGQAAGQLQLRVFDGAGRTVLQRGVLSTGSGMQRHGFNAAELPSGAYWFELRGAEQWWRGHLVVQH
jgi:hypothetical protein